MRREQAEAIAVAGGEPARALVVDLIERLEALGGQVAAGIEQIERLEALGGRVAAGIEQIAALAAEVEELKRIVDRDSQNSSLPPSSDPPKSRAERRRAAREAYKRSMRKSGGQPGHEGKTREMVCPERVDRRFEHLPERCGCGHRFDGSEEQAGDPVVHQQFELPVIVPLVFEHARLRLVCPECQRAALASLSAGAGSGFGPRIDAHIAMLAGVFRLSRDQVRRTVVEVFAIPASVGSIDNAIMRMSQVLADPWGELREAIQEADVVHADETTWRLRGAQQWLWVAASALMACYRIDPSRGQAAAKELLGEDFGGFLVSDRYAGYHFLDVVQQQLCWAHVIRQLIEVSQRQGATARRGRQLVALARQVIAAHREFLTAGHDHDWLTAEASTAASADPGALGAVRRRRHARTARFAAGLLDEYDALWTFCDVPDLQIDPTNNRAERAVRHAVLQRKIQGGTQSDRGSRWIERIQSVRETCRLQDRPVLDWLLNATTAAHHRRPVPTLLPAAAAQSP